MTRQPLKQVDTVIVGNGPSALILSYILHGNIPVYDIESPHPDAILHAKLQSHPDLLTGDVDHLTEHFYGSRFPYSTQALPINVLLDTLIRPYGETDESSRKSCVKWTFDPARAVPHVVFGKATQTGGQWADNPVKASWDIGALSYAGMLSLPGYSFEQYYQDVHGKNAPFFLRPTRRDVAGYLAQYPRMVGIEDSILGGEEATGILRHETGFLIASHGLRCSHLVLASGTFTSLVPARPLLKPLLDLNTQVPASQEPILVIGSGFSAADVILSTPSHQKIIHVYKWAPKTNPSPLRACHQEAYPEYAGVYRKMRDAATLTSKTGQRPPIQRAMSIVEQMRDWQTSYEGLPNTVVSNIEMQGSSAIVTFQRDGHEPFQRQIGSFAYVAGRRGSLHYLHEPLRSEICPDTTQWHNVTASTLREKVSESLEVASNVFVTGSLTGDSLIRFGYGACAYAAGRIMAARIDGRRAELCSCSFHPVAGYNRKLVPAMKGIQGHEIEHFSGHELQLDRRKSEVRCEGS